MMSTNSACNAANVTINGGVHHHHYYGCQPLHPTKDEDHDDRIGLLEHLVEELMEQLEAQLREKIKVEVKMKDSEPKLENIDADDEYYDAMKRELKHISDQRVQLREQGCLNRSEYDALNKRKAVVDRELYAEEVYPDSIFDDLVS